MNKIIIALAVVLAILVGLLAFFLIREKNDAAKEPTQISTVETVENTEATEETELTEAPTQTDAPETEATEATEVTEETAPLTEATEATEETEEPTETTEAIDISATNSGQFSSSTGTGMDIVVDWNTYTSSDGTKMVRFDVSLLSFTINVGPRVDGIHITMDGVTKSFDSADVTWSGSQTTHKLGSGTMEMSGDTAEVDVAWDFRGSYAGEQLDKVTASGTVTR